MKPQAVLCTLVFFAFSCDTTAPPPPPTHVQTISLAVVDSGVTDAWLRVTFLDTVQNKTFRLLRDSELVVETRLFARETVVIDTGLLPNTSYSYKAYHQINGSPVDSTDRVFLRTMDTTSHNFTFQIDTLGDGGSSILCDVAIISESNVWAVGEMYLRDSTGQLDPLPYNVAHWNGVSWELRRVTVDFRGLLITPPLEGIFAFSPTDIWLIGSIPIHGDGITWTAYDIVTILNAPVSVSKGWGQSSSNMYFVGRQGTIVHFGASSWQRIESGTMLPFQDIFGSANVQSSGFEILAVASNKFLNEGKRLLRIQDNSVSVVSDSGLSWSLSTVWFIPGRRYYVAGDGIYPSRSAGPVWYRDAGFPAIYKDAVRGIGLNDVAVSGSNGLLSHFNGVSWKHYQSNELPFFTGRYSGVGISQNMIAAVGYIDNKAIAVIGMR